MRTERSGDARAGTVRAFAIAPKPAGSRAPRQAPCGPPRRAGRTAGGPHGGRARVNPRAAPGGSDRGGSGHLTGRWYARR